MLRRVGLAMSIALSGALFGSSAAAASKTTTFPFEDARYLRSNDHDGGLVHAPASKEALPLLVFLHGVNEAGPLHFGLGGGPFDLRSVADDLATKGATRAFAVAGPSQNKEAWTGSRLWSGFDLDAFVDAAESALGDGKIDRSLIVVAGHSGAGCNQTGGILAPGGKIKPRAILALDTCMDGDFGKLLGEVTRRAPVMVFHQTAIWKRDVGPFTAAFDLARADADGAIEKLDIPGPDPHNDIAAAALRRALPGLLPLDIVDD